MKTRRIWIVIVVILIAGVCSTTYTKRYVSEREMDPSMRVMTEAAMDEAAETAAGTDASAPMPFAAAAPADVDAGIAMQKLEEAKSGDTVTDSSAEVPLPQESEEAAGSPQAAMMGAPQADDSAAANGETASLPEGAVRSAPGLGAAAPSPQSAPTGAATQAMTSMTGSAETAAVEPAATAQSSVVVAGGGKDKAGVSYKTRLEELDAQIERNRAADAEKSVGNSVKARAENELKLWEAELDGIIKALEARLSTEEVEKLYTEQREWRRERESNALEVSKKQSGSSLEEVEYTASLTSSTRARAYALVKEYEAVLEK